MNPAGRPGHWIGGAVGWAWSAFARNAAALVGATVGLGVVGVVFATLLLSLLNAVSPETFAAVQSGDNVFETATGSIGGTGVAVLGLALAAALLAGGVIASAWYNGLLSIADGQRVSIRSFLRPRNGTSLALASLLTGSVSAAAGVIAMTVPAVGGVLSAAVVALVTLVTFFAAVAIVDGDLAPLPGIRASLQTARAHPGPVALAWILFTAVLVVGGILFAGLLLAVPIAYLFKVFMWRRLSGGHVPDEPTIVVAD